MLRMAAPGLAKLADARAVLDREIQQKADQIDATAKKSVESK